MSSRVRVAGVVVPARDEEALLPSALTALEVAARQARLLGVEVDVLVVADSCTDGTAEVARAAGVRVLAVTVGSVGTARGLGLRDVLARHGSVPRDRVWLASTDADSRVPPDWLVRQLELAAAGTDLVVGTVEVDDWSGHPPHVEARWRAGYDGRDGHGHVHGANVGARADAYLEVGGFSHTRHGEDQALLDALVAAGHPVLRTRAIAVTTSGRLRGRAPGGLAEHLDRLDRLTPRSPAAGARRAADTPR